ncbi:MAG: hypothetical protein WCC60_01890 [Ilumatobacteraceae bacterium]
MSNDADSPISAQLLRRGVLLGSLAGLAAGLVWFLVVLGTSSLQAYLVPAFGVAVAYGVYIGMRSPGQAAALMSAVITLVSVAFAVFYVERHLVLDWFRQSHDSLRIPLFPYLDWVVAVLRHAVGKSPALVVYSLLALVAAGWFGNQGFESHDPHRRRS